MQSVLITYCFICNAQAEMKRLAVLAHTSKQKDDALVAARKIGDLKRVRGTHDNVMSHRSASSVSLFDTSRRCQHCQHWQYLSVLTVLTGRFLPYFSRFPLGAGRISKYVLTGPNNLK